MEDRRINVQNIMLLLQKKGDQVDEFNLVAEAERLYRSIKIVGLNNTRVCYEEKDGKLTVMNANELPERARAIAAFLMVLIYRWNDTNMGRLEEHFGLPTNINLLVNADVFTNTHAGLKCICVKDFVDMYRK